MLPLVGGQIQLPENQYFNPGMIGVDAVQALVFFVNIMMYTRRWNLRLLNSIDGTTSAELQRRVNAKRLRQQIPE